MSHVYYLRHVPTAADASPLTLLRDVRSAMRLFAPKATAADAEKCIEAVRERGYGVLGAIDDDSVNADEVLQALRAALSERGCEVVMDLDTARADHQWRMRKAQRDGFTPEQVFAGDDLVEKEAPQPREGVGDPAYETAMTLLAINDGNSGQAAATALNLGRTTRQEAFYHEVVVRLMQTFPWIEQPLRQSGLLK